MSFFAVKIEPGLSFKLDVDEPFRITNASLGELKGTERSVLMMSVDESEDNAIVPLTPQHKEQATLDINVHAGEAIELKVLGPNTIHLTGYYVPEMDEDDEDMYGDEMSDEEEDSEMEELDAGDAAMLKKLMQEGEMDDSDMDEDMSEDEKAKITEIIEEQKTKPVAAKKEQKQEAAKPKENKKQEDKQVHKPEVKQSNEKKRPAEDKDAANKKKKDEVSEKTSETPKKGNIKKHDNGLTTEDIVVGTGARAKNKKNVSIRYIGTLTSNGKQFDANTSGKPFTFKLGAGEVIAGFDAGIQGMQVGGKRRIVIPSASAYGKKGAPPDIPPNASLTFEMELIKA